MLRGTLRGLDWFFLGSLGTGGMVASSAGGEGKSNVVL